MNDDWDLENARSEASESWKPAIGEWIKGSLMKAEMVPNKYRPEEKSLVIRFRDQDGKLRVFFPPTDCRRQIVERYKAGVIGIGKPIGLKRCEDLATKNGTMKSFVVKPDMPADGVPPIRGTTAEEAMAAPRATDATRAEEAKAGTNPDGSLF